MKPTHINHKVKEVKDMTEYIKKADKNGRGRFYKSVDGRLKAVSRAEYEANTQPEGKPEDAALETVRGIVTSMERDGAKVKAQSTRSSVLINYRNCMVCALDFGEDHTVTGIRFMGVTLESRKKAAAYEVKDLSEYASQIAEQVEFIDWWWANTSKKKAM